MPRSRNRRVSNKDQGQGSLLISPPQLMSQSSYTICTIRNTIQQAKAQLGGRGMREFYPRGWVGSVDATLLVALLIRADDLHNGARCGKL